MWASYLIPDDGFLDGCEVLERGEQDVTPLGTADILDEIPELLAQGHEDLILILDGFCIQRVSSQCSVGRGRVESSDK